MNRSDQLFNAWAKFHAENPLVWLHFERIASAKRAAGVEHWSAQGVFEDMRGLPIMTTGKGIKLNNNLVCFYARFYLRAHPEHEGFFRLRRRSSEKRSAQAVDIQEWPGVPADEETDLNAKLDALLY